MEYLTRALGIKSFQVFMRAVEHSEARAQIARVCAAAAQRAHIWVWRPLWVRVCADVRACTCVRKSASVDFSRSRAPRTNFISARSAPAARTNCETRLMSFALAGARTPNTRTHARTAHTSRQFVHARRSYEPAHASAAAVACRCAGLSIFTLATNRACIAMYDDRRRLR